MAGVDNPITVLLVEDLEDDRYIFERTVKKARPNVQLFTANDGIEVLDYLQNKGRFADAHAFPTPDFMFLDLKMPVLDGFDVLRWMKERALLNTVPVIVLSGSSEPQDVALARELGARDYIVKPITLEQLITFLPA